MIKITDVNCTKNNKNILKDINLSFDSKEKIAIIGPSGAGKTTLLNILSKHETHFSGIVTINDIEIKTLNQRALAHKVGTISQDITLIDNLKVINNTLSGKLKDWSFFKSLLSVVVPQEKESAMAALKSVHMAEHYNKKTSELSGGEKQRVAIARLLMQDPSIVLADEPIASLDPSLAKKSIELLLNTTTDKTLIMVLHHVEYALKYFDRIIAIKDGEIYFDRHSKDITKELLGALYEL